MWGQVLQAALSALLNFFAGLLKGNEAQKTQNATEDALVKAERAEQEQVTVDDAAARAKRGEF